jgi:dTDP-4-dehydrorhamnose 3,5-epimerase
MRFREAGMAGLFVVELEPFVDDRGDFARCFCEREFASRGLPVRFPQCNLSQNRRRGTLRGMHFRAGPTAEAKFVRCVAGAIHDVVVDLRPRSSTRFRWVGMELTAQNGRALFVPGGFAHGFVTLEDNTRVFYQMSDFYRPDAERGFRWDDRFFRIEWPVQPAVMSARDASYPDFEVPSNLEEILHG